MKKLFLSVVLSLAVFSLSLADNFAFKYKGKIVADGETVDFEAQYDILKGQMVCATYGTLSLANLSGTAQTYDCRFQVNDNSFDGSGMQICLGGTCRKFTDAISFSFSSENASEATLIDVHPGAYGSMLTTLTATSGGETHTVRIRFTYTDPTGVDNVASTPGLVDIYSMDGVLLHKAVSLENVTGLKGLYIVKEHDAHKGIRSRKVIFGDN